MEAEKQRLIECIKGHPEEIGKSCGLTLLREHPHGDWIRQMVFGNGDMTLLAHRGSYKTTSLAVGISLSMVLQPQKNIIFLRKTDSDVTEVVEMVKMLLQSRLVGEMTRVLYGRKLEVARSERNTARTNCYFAIRGAPQLIGQGVYGSLTGKHGDRIFTDDIVNLEDRISQSERLHTRQIYQELQNIRIAGGRIINCGTPWHPEDAISLMPNVAKWDCRRTGLMTEEEIREKQRVMTPALFSVNYLLQHTGKAETVFSQAPQTHYPVKLLCGGIAHVDAAYGGSDWTALTVGVRLKTGIVMLGKMWQCHVESCMDQITDICMRLGAAPIYLETNADKGYLAREFRGRGISVRPYHEQMQKSIKISVYLKKYWDTIAFAEGTDPEYIAQIMDWSEDTRNHDDAPDSAACLCRVLDRKGE